jgi:hypothetical protein
MIWYQRYYKKMPVGRIYRMFNQNDITAITISNKTNKGSAMMR